MTLKIQSPDGQKVLAALITLAQNNDGNLNLANAWKEIPDEIPFEVSSSDITEVLHAYTSNSEICNPQTGKIACVFMDDGNGEYRLTADEETCEAFKAISGSHVSPNSIPGAEIFTYKEVQPEFGALNDDGQKQQEAMKTGFAADLIPADSVHSMENDSRYEEEIASKQKAAAENAAFGTSHTEERPSELTPSVSEENLSSIENQMSDEERKSSMDSYPSYAHFDHRNQPGNYVPASEDEKQDQMNEAIEEAAGLCVCACTTAHVDKDFMENESMESGSTEDQEARLAKDESPEAAAQADSGFGRLTREDMANIYKPDYMSALSAESSGEDEAETAKAVEDASDTASFEAVDGDENEMVLPYETITTSGQAEQSVQVELAERTKAAKKEADHIGNLNKSAASLQQSRDEATSAFAANDKDIQADQTDENLVSSDSSAGSVNEAVKMELDADPTEMALPYETITTSDQAEQSVQVELADRIKAAQKEADHIGNLNKSAASMQQVHDDVESSRLAAKAGEMSADLDHPDEKADANLAFSNVNEIDKEDQKDLASLDEVVVETAASEDQVSDPALMADQDISYGSREEQELRDYDVDYDVAAVQVKDANEPEALYAQANDIDYGSDLNPFNQARFQMDSEGRNTQANRWAYDFEQNPYDQDTEEFFAQDETVKVTGLDEDPSAVWSCVRDPQSSMQDVDVEIETASEKRDRLNDLWNDNAKIDRKIKQAQDKIAQQERKISDHIGQIERDESNAMKSLHESQIRHNKKVIDRKERKINKLQDQIIQNVHSSGYKHNS